MGFLVYCDNKGCGQDQEAVLDVQTNEVLCQECGKPIKSITSFAKAQMKSLGQIKRADQKHESFSVKCDECKKQGQPKLDSNNKIVCAFCNKEMVNIPKPFQQVIRINIHSKNSL